MSDVIESFAPFIQEFIYRERWTKLRPIQIDAAEGIFTSDDHLLICSGTASGKTEAAFLPVLSDLYRNPSQSIGVLYVGPLKALINDQFERLNLLLSDANIPVQNWHGDVSQSKKQRFLRQSSGILQITPESMEAMLMRREKDMARLFGDLRYVIIDEVHAFIGSDRGQQVQCQLGRLERFQSRPPRRIGLSATIGDIHLTADWLRGKSPRNVRVIEDQQRKRNVEIGIEYYPGLKLDQLSGIAEDNKQGGKADQVRKFAKQMYQWTANGKTLVFVNSRANAEMTALGLRNTAKEHRTTDIYHVHHGSIDASVRDMAEKAMQEPGIPACTVATVTLELGIDVGALDQVMQVNAPNSVSSFLQRLGRSGRRDQPSRMFFFCFDSQKRESANVIDTLPWDLLQTIATLQLYIEDRWIEPPYVPRYPFSLLYHQTMSILAGSTQLTPPELAESVLTLPAFAAITTEHLRQFLRHLIDLEHIERMDSGHLIVGRKAERLINDYHFYATFKDNVDFQVWHESKPLGSIQYLPRVDSRIVHSGQIWRVTSIDSKGSKIYVEPSSGSAELLWRGSGPGIHSRIVKKMQAILAGNSIYSYLLPSAREALSQAREAVQGSALLSETIIQQGNGEFLMLPWTGTRAFQTITSILTHAGIATKQARSPIYLRLGIPECETANDATHILRNCFNSVTSEALAKSIDQANLIRGKYDEFVPQELLTLACATDWLDLDGARATLR